MCQHKIIKETGERHKNNIKRQCMQCGLVEEPTKKSEIRHRGNYAKYPYEQVEINQFHVLLVDLAHAKEYDNCTIYTK